MKYPIKHVRESLGMTQESFAKILGKCTKSAIANYESGLRTPRHSIGYKILEIANSNGIKISFEDLYPRKSR